MNAKLISILRTDGSTSPLQDAVQTISGENFHSLLGSIPIWER